MDGPNDLVQWHWCDCPRNWPWANSTWTQLQRNTISNQLNLTQSWIGRTWVWVGLKLAWSQFISLQHQVESIPRPCRVIAAPRRQRGLYGKCGHPPQIEHTPTVRTDGGMAGDGGKGFYSTQKKGRKRTKPPITGADFLTIIYPRPRYHFDDFPKKIKREKLVGPWISLIFSPFTTDFSLFFLFFVYFISKKSQRSAFGLGSNSGGVDGPTQPTTIYRILLPFSPFCSWKIGSSVSLLLSHPNLQNQKNTSHLIIVFESRSHLVSIPPFPSHRKHSKSQIGLNRADRTDYYIM